MAKAKLEDFADEMEDLVNQVDTLHNEMVLLIDDLYDDDEDEADLARQKLIVNAEAILALAQRMVKV